MTKTEKKYIEIMRKKSGEERLRIAIELRKLALKLAEAGKRSRQAVLNKKIWT